MWGSLGDIAHQKSMEQQIITLEDYTNSYMQAYGLNYPVGSLEYRALESQMYPIYSESFKEAEGANFDVILDEFGLVVPSRFSSVVQLLERGNTELKNINLKSLTKAEGNPTNPAYVILLPHSQGNLYANELYDYLISNNLFDKTEIAAYGIGSAANSNDGGVYMTSSLVSLEHKTGLDFGNINSYLTSNNDFVISGERILWSKTLPGNFEIPFNLSFPLGHNLIEVYLSNQAASAQISKMIDLYMSIFISVFSSTDNMDVNNIGMSASGVEGGLGVLMGPDGYVYGNGLAYLSSDKYLSMSSLINGGAKIHYLPHGGYTPGTYYGLAPLSGYSGFAETPLYINFPQRLGIYYYSIGCYISGDSHGNIVYNCSCNYLNHYIAFYAAILDIHYADTFGSNPEYTSASMQRFPYAFINGLFINSSVYIP